MKWFKYVASITLLILFFQNCGTNYGITQNNSTDPVVSLETPASPGNPTFKVEQQNFTSQTTLKEVDMVWVIDNSRSMEKEATNVRNNFERFIKQLGSQVDIKVALISGIKQNAYNTQVALPASAKNGVNLEIDYFVDSYNATLLTAAATCKPTDTGICETLRRNTRYARIMGQLNSFLRPNSSKVFIYVTDDDPRANSNGGIQIDMYPEATPQNVNNVQTVENSHFISDTTFIQHMDTALGQQSPYRVFGFIATKASSTSTCEVSRESTVMKSIIGKKNGAYFDICNPDWSGYFNQLVDKIYLYAQTDYVLSQVELSVLKRVVSVKMNGSFLNAGTDYTIQGKQISLRQDLISGSGVYNLEVTYERWL